MRVIAGSRKGHKLAAPRGLDTRPTSDRVRENIFNLVGPVDDARVLDLFAGSGAMGIEALSRGAASAVFVEHDADAVRTIERNLDRLRLTGARVVRGDVLRTIAQEATAGAKYDLVLVDPPYGMLTEIQPRLARHLPPLARSGRPRRGRDRRAHRARAAAARAHEPQVRPDARHALRGAAVITAIAPGSYDPVTNGHVDVITRAAGIFDRVVVGVVGTPQHKEPMFAVEERVEFLRDALSGLGNVEIDVFRELVVDFARRWDAKAIVKGLRVISDFEWEFQMNQLNRTLAPEVETVYVMASPQVSFVSSSGVKEIAAFGGDVSALVPAAGGAPARGDLPGRTPRNAGTPGRVTRELSFVYDYGQVYLYDAAAAGSVDFLAALDDAGADRSDASVSPERLSTSSFPCSGTSLHRSCSRRSTASRRSTSTSGSTWSSSCCSCRAVDCCSRAREAAGSWRSDFRQASTMPAGQVAASRRSASTCQASQRRTPIACSCGRPRPIEPPRELKRWPGYDVLTG